MMFGRLTRRLKKVVILSRATLGQEAIFLQHNKPGSSDSKKKMEQYYDP